MRGLAKRLTSLHVHALSHWSAVLCARAAGRLGKLLETARLFLLVATSAATRDEDRHAEFGAVAAVLHRQHSHSISSLPRLVTTEKRAGVEGPELWLAWGEHAKAKHIANAATKLMNDVRSRPAMPPACTFAGAR